MDTEKAKRGSKKPVTQREVTTLGDGIHTVAPCLYLRVQGNKRSFVFRFQKNGKRKEIGLGSAFDLTIQQAKAEANRCRAELAEGKELIGKVEKNKRQAQVKQEKTFSDVCAEAIPAAKEVRKWKNAKSEKGWWRVVNTYAMPAFANLPINLIGRDEVAEVLKPIWHTKTPTAVSLRQMLERIFAHAIFTGDYHGANPATFRGNLDFILAPSARIHSVEHYAALDFENCRITVQKLLESGNVSGIAAAFGALVALRANEFLQAKWSEIDFEKKIFLVPPERRKTFRDYPHRVPLSNQAMLILYAMKTAYPDRTFVFPSVLYDDRAIHRDSVLTAVKRAAPMKATIHGFRSTFRVWAEETGQNTTAAEYQMMHENPSAVVRAYQRSDLLEQRRELMQRWADALLPMDVLKKTLGATPKQQVRNVPELEKIYGDKFKCF
jgi:integrase|nr:MAG TPA_asm: Integrase [Caudoviricetes sp.]